jgi:hypothetical protein
MSDEKTIIQIHKELAAQTKAMGRLQTNLSALVDNYRQINQRMTRVENYIYGSKAAPMVLRRKRGPRKRRTSR